MPRKSNWTQEMYDKLASLYPHHTNKELEQITGRCTKELQYRAGRLGLVKTKDVERKALTRVEYTVDHEAFIRENWSKYTNRELAELMGFSIQYIRTKCYELGLLRMELQYWTDEQTEFLIDHYQLIGDKEMAEIFNSKWKKEKGWSFKHIEKKRKYLKLNRTEEEIHNVYLRNLENGRWLNKDIAGRWDKTNMAKDGDIRLWKGFGGRMIAAIKVSGKWCHWAPWAWTQEHGPIPEGHVISYIGDSSIISTSNLECITRDELARRVGKTNKNLTDNNVAAMLSRKDPELRKLLRENKPLLELKRQQILLNRAINQQS
jgi:hypothetical protein